MYKKGNTASVISFQDVCLLDFRPSKTTSSLPVLIFLLFAFWQVFGRLL